MDLELPLDMNGIKKREEILIGLAMVESVFLVAAVHMRHAEFEECMAHEAFVKEMKTRHIRKFNRRHLNFKTPGKRNVDRPQKK